MVGGIVAVGVGAAFGAWLRWGLSIWLNPRVPHFPLGTLAANLVGGYLVGFAIAYFAARQELPPEVRLFAITGFLGALTTFSTFSAESVMLLQQARFGAAFAHASLHLFGSVLATIAGFASWRLLHA